MPDHPLQVLAALDGVASAVAEARAACEQLRWHRALRRTWPAARAESGIRCAHAGAVVDGLRLPLDLVRDVARDAADAPPGPDGQALLAALRVQAVVEALMPAPGSTGTATSIPFAQLLVRLHVAAAGGAPQAEPGRLRSVEQPSDVLGLGRAPTGPELSGRLARLGELAAVPRPSAVPALVMAAVVHGELLALRPFRHANGAVARGLFRLQLTLAGVDPVGVVVPDALWAETPNVYLSAAAGFATGSAEGVGGWLRHCAASVTRGAAEGTAVADAVLAGRLHEREAAGDDTAVHDDGAP